MSYTVVHPVWVDRLNESITIGGPFDSIQQAIKSRKVSGDIILKDGRVFQNDVWLWDWEKRDTNSFARLCIKWTQAGWPQGKTPIDWHKQQKAKERLHWRQEQKKEKAEIKRRTAILCQLREIGLE